MEKSELSLSKAKGGEARALALSPAERKAIAATAAKARWARARLLPRASHSGTLKIGDLVFPCSVLTDETRVLTQSDFMAGMGMYYSGWVAKNRSKDEASAGVPHFLAFKSLEPFINKHLGHMQSVTISYITEKGGLAHGIRAETIPKICEVWLDADDAIKLGIRQKQIAKRARTLMRALAHVGIIALVDEATGYQAVRSKDALQQVLELYLLKDLAAWVKRFPDEFYEEIYRLRGWAWKGMSTNRISACATYTNDFIYDRIAPGLRKEMEVRNPVLESGRRKGKHHSLLTEEIGIPNLAKHFGSVITLQKLSKTWEEFEGFMSRFHPRRGDTLPFDFVKAVEVTSTEQPQLSLLSEIDAPVTE